jgi:MtN3 and saliva related transmembrane protein
MNIPTEYIGYAGALLTAINFLPQVIKVYKTKDAEELSFWTLVLILLAQSVWMIYAFRLDLIPVLISNASLFLLALILLIMKFVYKKKGTHQKQPKYSKQ